MATLVRTWLRLAGLGAGLIHLAAAAGTPPALLATFAVLGAAEGAWGATALARRTVPLPCTAVAAAILPPLVWVRLLLAGAGSAHGTEHASGANPGGMDALAESLP